MTDVSVLAGVPLPLSTSATSTTISWTPTFTFSVPGTFSMAGLTVVGIYQRLGDQIFADFRISGTPTLGTASGGVVLGIPVPFSSMSGALLGGMREGSIKNAVGLTLPTGLIRIFPDGGGPNGTTTNLAYTALAGGAATTGPIGTTHFTTGTPFTLDGSMRYYAA